MSRPHPSTVQLRRSGFHLLREGPRVEVWAKVRRDGNVVMFSSILRGTRDRDGNVASTLWKLTVLKRFNARQRGELRNMLRGLQR